MVSRELLQLAPERREAAGLDLDQQLAPDEVDDETVDELLMQRTLVERSDRGAGCTGLGGRVHWQGSSSSRRSRFPSPRPGHQPRRLASARHILGHDPGSTDFRANTLSSYLPSHVGPSELCASGIRRAKIGDRKVSPHEGGIAALSQRFRFESGAFRVGARRWS
jgi:hypothetical protein